MQSRTRLENRVEVATSPPPTPQGGIDRAERRALLLFHAASDPSRIPLLESLLAILAEEMPYPSGAFYVSDEWTELYMFDELASLFTQEAAREVPSCAPAEFRLGEGPLGQAAETGRIAVLTSGLDTMDWGDSISAPLALVAVPVRHTGKTLGVLALVATETPGKADLDFLRWLGDGLGLTLNNLKQFADLKLLSDELSRSTEEITQKNLELEAANRIKSEFLATMSHELRTPLNAIIGFSEMLKDGLMGGLNGEQLASVEDIFASGTHLLALINDVLDLSKIEAGKLDLDFEPTDPRLLLESALVVVRDRAKAAGIALDLEAPPAMPAVTADPRRLKQIAFNLLSNAVKFTGKGGQVTVLARSVPRDEVRGALPDGEGTCPAYLEIAVRDTGIGIPAEALPTLFRPFVQLESSASRKFQGTGLGLALVKHLAGLHGGTVAVESVPALGSTFFVWIPYRGPRCAEESQA